MKNNILEIFLYKLGYIFFNIYFYLFHRWQIQGKNNCPEDGPLIVIANHVSYYDPPVVGSVLPRHVYFLAKKDLFENPVFGWFLKTIGVIPINRGKPDLKALKRSLNVLSEQKVLGLFPEGTRHKPGDLGKAKGGAVMIALKSKSPILPIGIKNVMNHNKKTKISIGKPFTLDKYYDKKLSKEEKKEVGKIMMSKIKQEIDKLES